jgi:hypothetical protein
MGSTSKRLVVGTPMLILMLILVIAILRVGAEGADTPFNDQADLEGEYQVEAVTIEAVQVRIAESFPVQVVVDVAGYLPDPCWEPQEPSVEQDGNQFIIEIVAERRVEEFCPQVIEHYEGSVALGQMDPGEYVVRVNEVEQGFEVH